jgi:hypothetical protein
MLFRGIFLPEHQAIGSQSNNISVIKISQGEK